MKEGSKRFVLSHEGKAQNGRGFHSGMGLKKESALKRWRGRGKDNMAGGDKTYVLNQNVCFRGVWEGKLFGSTQKPGQRASTLSNRFTGEKLKFWGNELWMKSVFRWDLPQPFPRMCADCKCLMLGLQEAGGQCKYPTGLDVLKWARTWRRQR